MVADLRNVALAVALALGAAAAATDARAAGDLNATANANAAGEISIDWSWTEYDPAQFPVVGRPDWVGYDLLRREPGACSPWVRLNDEIMPRVPGASHSGTFVDAPPATGVTYEYRLVMVNAAHEPIVLVWPEGCEPPCSPHAWESVPKLAAPVTIGTVTDWGWAVLVEACPGSCWSSFYVPEPGASLLRPYAGTGQAFRIHGDEGCGSVEGCGIALDRFEPADCGITPAARSGWGRLKIRYR